MERMKMQSDQTDLFGCQTVLQSPGVLLLSLFIKKKSEGYKLLLLKLSSPTLIIGDREVFLPALRQKE
jgi:hypothetical protein